MIYVGVVGSGPSTRKHLATLITDWAQGQDDEVGIVVSAADLQHDAVRHAADWALQKEHALTVVVGHDYNEGDLEDYTGAQILQAPFTPHLYDHLFIAWDNERDAECEQVVEAAAALGVKAYDLTDGLYPIDVTPDPEPGADIVVPEVSTVAASRPKQPGPLQTADEAQASLIPVVDLTQQDDAAMVERVARRVIEMLVAGLGGE